MAMFRVTLEVRDCVIYEVRDVEAESESTITVGLAIDGELYDVEEDYDNATSTILHIEKLDRTE